MRDIYWAMYVTIKHKTCYYWHYSMSTKRTNGVITGILVAFSVSSIGTWVVLQQSPISWLLASFALFAQILQALTPHLPFAKRDISLNYLLPHLGALLLEIDSKWLAIELGEYSDKKISSLVDKFEKQYHDLSSKYAGAAYMPYCLRCDKKAEVDCRKFFSHRYNT